MSLRIASLVALLALSASASAVDLKQLKQAWGTQQSSGSRASGRGAALGGSAMPAISGRTAGNAAGVLEYCVQRKYLSGNAVASVKDKLLSRAGLGAPARARQDTGYARGLQGLLQGSGGGALDLDALSGKLKDKGCDYVLDHAKSLV